MSDSTDPLLGSISPDRVFYANGQLLDAEDFQAEQNYHRSRLARVLSFLHGSGTAAGLKVEWTAAKPASGATPAQEEMLTLDPGMAIDRVGRIIEVPRSICIRLDRWYQQQPVGLIWQSWHAAADVGADDKDGNANANDGVVADLFVRYVACERGKTPAFASGNEDATDAAVPSRLRDWFEVKLFLRPEQPTPPLPQNHWPDLSGIADPKTRHRTLGEAVFTAWPASDATDLAGFNPAGFALGPEPITEYLNNQDPTSVFLARLVLPATRTADTTVRPVRDTTKDVLIDNHRRLFVYPPRALAAPESL